MFILSDHWGSYRFHSPRVTENTTHGAGSKTLIVVFIASQSRNIKMSCFGSSEIEKKKTSFQFLTNQAGR